MSGFALLNDDMNRTKEDLGKQVNMLVRQEIEETEQSILGGNLTHDKYRESVAVLTAIKGLEEKLKHLMKER